MHKIKDLVRHSVPQKESFVPHSCAHATAKQVPHSTDSTAIVLGKQPKIN